MGTGGFSNLFYCKSSIHLFSLFSLQLQIKVFIYSSFDSLLSVSLTVCVLSEEKDPTRIYPAVKQVHLNTHIAQRKLSKGPGAL